jgi:hypothetical protein
MKLLVWDPKKKKTVLCGILTPTGKTLGRVVKPEHFMNIVQGYGIQEIAFEKALQMGVKQIALQEIHTHDVLLATSISWLNMGKVADYGSGKQRFLSVKYMKRIKHGTSKADGTKEQKNS